ncbi:Uncharacterized protein TCM_028604 [Theobroma cacao]|uniref:Uncharacterized protein n=1 Tax=Theobroma cacao TaxID=3641 RepID=A0A061GBB1_THECC|nr:Uncharacterized protein TCM_028604 [Theobroma cacao]
MCHILHTGTKRNGNPLTSKTWINDMLPVTLLKRGKFRFDSRFICNSKNKADESLGRSLSTVSDASGFSLLRKSSR